MAKSSKIGGIYAELFLKDIKFRQGLKSAGKQLGSFSMKAVKAGSAIAAGVGAGLAIGTKKMVAYGAELDHLSSQTGVAVSSLMRIQQAYKDAGKEASSAGKDIGKMQRAIYDAAQDPGSTLDYFAEFGMSAQELMGMNPEQQFFAIGKAIASIENPTKQAAMALSIFGRSGGELLTVFKGSDIDDVNESLGKMPEIMDQFSGAMERADTLMGRLPAKSDQFFTGFTAGVIGQILPALESVNDKDFTELGKNIGDGVALGIELLISGDIWEIFSKQAEIAILKLDQQMGGLMNSLAAHMNAAWDVITGAGGFSEGIAKYSAAGLTVEEDLVDLRKQVADLMERSRQRVEFKQDSASSFANPPVADFLSDADMERLGFAVGEGVAMAEAEQDKKEPERFDFETARSGVNTMQARGLAQGAIQDRRKEDKKITMMEEMVSILRDAQTNGELVFR
jgi:hypothetical protein